MLASKPGLLLVPTTTAPKKSLVDLNFVYAYSAGTGELCIFGHLGLTFIFELFCMFPFFHYFCFTWFVLTEGTQRDVIFDISNVVSFFNLQCSLTVLDHWFKINIETEIIMGVLHNTCTLFTIALVHFQRRKVIWSAIRAYLLERAISGVFNYA